STALESFGITPPDRFVAIIDQLRRGTFNIRESNYWPISLANLPSLLSFTQHCAVSIAPGLCVQ
ncbi:hypothetical protein ABIB42_001712, partial [Massilia sp. UYP32]